jgi:anti-sigma factor RsiW
MSCDLYKDKLEAYVLGLLNPAEIQQVKEHTQICADCRQEVSRLQNAAQLIKGGFDQAPPAYLRSKVLANLKDSRQPKRNWLAWATPALLGVAVVVLMIKIEPGRIAKQPVQLPEVVEQKPVESVFAVAAPKPRAEIPSSGLWRRRTKRKSLLPMAPAPAAAQPSSVAQESQANSAPQADFSSQVLGKISAADEEKKEQVASGPKQVSDFKARMVKSPAAPAKREAAAAEMAGGAQSMSAAAPAQFEMQSLNRGSSQNEEAKEQEAEPGIPAKATACLVTLVITVGQVDSQMVQPEMDKFAQRVKTRILQAGDIRTVLVRITIDQQGKVLTAQYAGQVFASADLNQFILNEIGSLRFPQPTGSAQAVIKIEIK